MQYEFLRWPFNDNEMFPKVIEDYGDIGETSDGSMIYLIEVERLTPVSRATQMETKRAVRNIVQDVARACRDAEMHVRGTMHEADRQKLICTRALSSLAERDSTAEPLREAYEDIANFCANFDCSTDIQTSNMMLRGDQVVFSDPVIDVRALIRSQQRLYR
jgi:hypothetical protein